MEDRYFPYLFNRRGFTFPHIAALISFLSLLYCTMFYYQHLHPVYDYNFAGERKENSSQVVRWPNLLKFLSEFPKRTKILIVQASILNWIKSTIGTLLFEHFFNSYMLGTQKFASRSILSGTSRSLKMLRLMIRKHLLFILCGSLKNSFTFRGMRQDSIY